MTQYALIFEAESIQSYIFDSGRLSDAVGASVRLDQLCGDLAPAGPEDKKTPDDLLSRVIATVLGREIQKKNDPDVAFSRRGGGAFIALFQSAALRDRVQALWSATLADVAPGLRFGLVASEGIHALAAAEAGMQAMKWQRNQPAPSLPETGPLTRLAPRTGRAAVQTMTENAQKEWVDAQTLVHRQRARRFNHDRLTARFSTDLQNWPSDLEREFPFNQAGHKEIAVVHADGNGLGVALQELAKHCKKTPDHYVEAYAGFSEAVSQATRAAAAHATNTVLAPKTRKDGFVPARPLVLGGDDLTILLRPDVAVPFTQAFLAAFEVETEKELKEARQKFNFLPVKLTAAAGIAIVQASHPFDRALHLAESLCGMVKSATKKRVTASEKEAPSGLMFYRQTVSLLDDWQDVQRVETTPKEAEEGVRYCTVHGPYLLHASKGEPTLPALAQLQTLADVLARPALANGPVRQLITQLHQSPATARKSWQRIWEMLAHRQDAATQTALRQALQALGLPAAPDALPCAHRSESPSDLHSTPLNDALTLAHLAVTQEEEA
ncbi:Diguanylate cyclase [Vitreoscilla filiformis]|uniref:Diguanylate cyclase n=1 Tax=Vitreoscilla filiformis TaxID=63 RepID=A0A221KG63_VITFI|nr:hypothetical protein [Vitreoscilla filiformis]ASM77919.1 Diguanylate cyclase [Vitreoscilla filiformis]